MLYVHFVPNSFPPSSVMHLNKHILHQIYFSLNFKFIYQFIWCWDFILCDRIFKSRRFWWLRQSLGINYSGIPKQIWLTSRRKKVHEIKPKLSHKTIFKGIYERFLCWMLELERSGKQPCHFEKAHGVIVIWDSARGTLTDKGHN